MADKNSSNEPIVDALTETSAAIFERVKSGNERAHRISTAVIKGAEWLQQETLDLGRNFAQEPTDLAGFSEAAFKKAGEAQDHAFAFVRNLVDEMATGARETRTTVERITRANTEVGRVAVDAARGFASRTGEALRPEFLRATEPVTKAVSRARRTTDEAA